MLSSIFGSYLVHKNPTCFSRWSFSEKRVPEDLFFLEDDAFLDIMRGINKEYENR